RFLFATVIVRTEIYGFLVDICQELVGDLCQAHFGVTHGGGAIAVDRAEVTLAVDQHVAQRKILRHADDGLVDGRITVRVILTNDVTDDTCRLLVRPIPVVVQLVHGEKHTPVHRLEAVPYIWKSAPHDHAHYVIEVAAPHFFF